VPRQLTFALSMMRRSGLRRRSPSVSRRPRMSQLSSIRAWRLVVAKRPHGRHPRRALRRGGWRRASGLASGLGGAEGIEPLTPSMRTTGVHEDGATSAAHKRCLRCMPVVVRCCCCTSCCTPLMLRRRATQPAAFRFSGERPGPRESTAVRLSRPDDPLGHLGVQD